MQSNAYMNVMRTPRMSCLWPTHGREVTNRGPLLQDRLCHKRPLGLLFASFAAPLEKMAASSTLLVRKLPQLLKKEEKDELLRQFGATSVDVLPPKGHMVRN